jgi:hypothetical protein
MEKPSSHPWLFWDTLMTDSELGTNLWCGGEKKSQLYFSFRTIDRKRAERERAEGERETESRERQREQRQKQRGETLEQ